MTRSRPPRLALALLQRFLHDNEPLAGDLLERFAVKQSRVWFWREVLMAIAVRGCQKRDHEHPLGLADDQMFERSAVRPLDRPRQINITASPLYGVGGLGLATFGALVAWAGAGVLWMFVPAVLGGVVLGLTLALVRRRAVLAGPATASRTLLIELEDSSRRSNDEA